MLVLPCETRTVFSCFFFFPLSVVYTNVGPWRVNNKWGERGGWEKAKGKIAPIAISQVWSPYKADSTRHLSVMTRLSAISLPYVFNSLRGRHD